MSKQLDILCLEPFYGGIRRRMLETLVKCSRHRWTVLRLPPRRIERRLTAAANWFGEQLSRHWVGRVDVLLVSEAMNLADLLRFVPALVRVPSVVYFHDNQLPDVNAKQLGSLDLININTATAASEIWFNSKYHQELFNARAQALISRHPEVAGMNPVPQLKAKSRIMPPPVDMDFVSQVRTSGRVLRNPQAIFFETRDADVGMINSALSDLSADGIDFTTITVGPVDELNPKFPRRTISESDDVAQVRGMLESSVVMSAKPYAASDFQVVRAMLAGCRPVVPATGVYAEMLPVDLHRDCLYAVHPDVLSDYLYQAISGESSAWKQNGLREAFRAFDSVNACRVFDDRLENVAANTYRM